VTAVVVGHDGAGWLTRGIDALGEQTRPVQRMVAVDTGSRDRSGTVLAGKFGQSAVFGMERSTGYAAAVRRALQHKAASAPLPVPSGSAARGRTEQIEWIWLLHDDCEPAPDALEQLLRGAAETPTAAVLGPKLMDWTDRDVVLETGLTLDSVGRRTTGIEPREVDQGQHDGDRDVLAVSSAGMLVRRDVWDQVGGFDPGMALFGEDIDLCWRVHAAGFRVRVITDAVVFHALAATRGRRPISVGRRARLLDRRNGLLTLLGNLPAGPMLVSLVANLAISLVRTVFYTVAKRGTAALDEAAAVLGVVGHPMRFAAARRRRARGRRTAYSRVRADLPSGHSLRRAAEFLALVVTRSAAGESTSGQSAIDDPDDDDSLLTDSGFLQRFITRPGVLLLAGLIIVTAVAEHSLIGGGPLGGGALVPAWEGASTLWGEVLRAFHPVGIGSASAAPPSAFFVAILATLLLGKTWLAVDVLLLGSVPLAGITALLALRPVTKSALVRVWAAASYALLPVIFGAVSAGRLGSAVAFVLIPLIGVTAGRMYSESRRLARRAAWATGLLVTVCTAFVPVVWPMAVVGAVIAVALLRRSSPALFNLLIVVATPLVLLLPWMTQLLAHPSLLLLEAGVQQPGLATAALPARSLLLLSPGGPGVPPYWTSAALVLVGLASLLATRRRELIVTGWCVALLGFVTALIGVRTVVTPAGGQAMTPWPGPALAVAAAGLVLAGAAGADSLSRGLSARGRKGTRRLTGARGIGIVVIGLAAASAPLLAMGYWLLHPVNGPVAPVSGQVVPSLGPVSSGSGRQLRTLVLSSSGGRVSYLLLRGDNPQFADPGLVQATAAQEALSQAVAALTAPGGGQVADQSQELARFDIGFVLVRSPANPQLVSTLGTVSGLALVSITPSFDLWRLTTLPARVTVVEPSGTVVPVNSGPIGLSGATAPATGGILELAEPAGGWSASLNGHALTPVTSPAGSWAQAFRLPAGGGTLSISRNALTHDLVTALELLAFVAVAVLALPGVRTAAEIEALAAANAELAQAKQGEEEEEGAAESAGVPAGAAAASGRGRRRGRGSARSRRAAGPARRGGRLRPTQNAAPGHSAVPGHGAVPAQAGEPEPTAERAGAGRSLRGTAGRAMPVMARKVAGGAGGAGRGLAEAEPAGPGVGGADPFGEGAADLSPAGLNASGPNPGAVGAGAAAGRGAMRGGRSGGAAAGPAGAAGGRTGPGGSGPRAAWPAGQPPSRFISEPPEPRPVRPDGDPAAWPQRDSGPDIWPSHDLDPARPPERDSGPGSWPGRASGPSGRPPRDFDPAGWQPRDRQSGPRPDEQSVRRPGARAGMSPSGTRFDDLPGPQEPPAAGSSRDVTGRAEQAEQAGQSPGRRESRRLGRAAGRRGVLGRRGAPARDAGAGPDREAGDALDREPGDALDRDAGGAQDRAASAGRRGGRRGREDQPQPAGRRGRDADDTFPPYDDSPTGVRFPAEDGFLAEDRSPYEGRSPSGSPYPPEPHRRGQPERHDDRQRSYQAAPDWVPDEQPAAGWGAPERAPDRPRSQSESARAASAWPEADRQAAWAEADRQAAWPEADRQAAWPEGDRQAAWPESDRQQAWPESDRQQAWPRDQRQGWPPEYQQGQGPGRQADPDGWGMPAQSWPAPADELEALPPAGEVHHDWPGRADRPTRGWIAPDEDADGESW
jgi:GT2 family glycosyltransferase